MMDLRLGTWEDVLDDVAEVSTVIVDPPYSERCHSGHDSAVDMVNAGRWPREGRRGPSNGDPRRSRSPLPYEYWTHAEVDAFVDSWAPRCRGWMVALSDSDLCAAWRAAFERHGLTGFQPVPCFMPGMTVRLCGDGPSSWTVYANVARPKSLVHWGTLPGGYYGKPGNRTEGDSSMVGGKPLWLMRALVRDYSKPGDLICDPCAGAATTLLAAAIEGRASIGAERSPVTWRTGADRLSAGFTPDLFAAVVEPSPSAEQISFDLTDIS